MRERGGIGGEGKDDEGMEKKENDEIKKTDATEQHGAT